MADLKQIDERLRRVETDVALLVSNAGKAEDAHRELKQMIGQMRSWQDRASGGYAALILLASIAGSLGALLMKFLPVGIK